VPTALAMQSLYGQRCRTLFYAHEVAALRRIAEQYPGHDVMLYNALEAGLRSGLYIDQVFGPQNDYFKYELVQASRFCDGLLAVGHHVVQELQFLGPEFHTADITLAFNGVPVRRTTAEDWSISRAHIERYLDAQLGWRPTWIFTHVTRLVRSKALWRDLDVLRALEAHLAERDESAVLLVLSTEPPRRPPEDIRYMEREWDWPLAHREGGPDLTAGEADFYQLVQAFNTRAQRIRVVFINQFGFSRALAGARVPEEAELIDLRRASDAEFGLSLYEPFGISPLETLTYGGLCVVSTSCGCTGLIKQAATRGSPNVLPADYIGAGPGALHVKDALEVGTPERRRVELAVARDLAGRLIERLPRTGEARAKLRASGYELARRMSWDAVVERTIFPAIRRAVSQRRILRMG
jgi:hypothetical protein